MENLKTFAILLLCCAVIEGFKNQKYPIVQKRQHWSPYIFGGEEVRNFSEFSYMLSMRYVDFHVCGASIIHLRWALTAAHCFEGHIFADMVSFRAGSMNRFMGGKIIHAEQFFLHPNFDAPTYNNDVAVVRSIEEFCGDNIRIIPLIGFNSMLRPGLKGTISGWGLTDEGSLPTHLQKLDLFIWNQKDCNEIWFGQVNSGMFCAGGEKGFDSCNGDSGGALVVSGTQIGIISAGATDCGVAYPSVFVNITNPLIRAFIRERTGV